MKGFLLCCPKRRGHRQLLMGSKNPLLNLHHGSLFPDGQLHSESDLRLHTIGLAYLPKYEATTKPSNEAPNISAFLGYDIVKMFQLHHCWNPFLPRKRNFPPNFFWRKPSLSRLSCLEMGDFLWVCGIPFPFEARHVGVAAALPASGFSAIWDVPPPLSCAEEWAETWAVLESRDESCTESRPKLWGRLQ